ncbi:glutathione S-transferase 1-like [Paramacrobiotus metropolitanus]|uniref:glutathione S-transferase 1-like n=1 Tax=Paramacrobiotus metropolitanus TaxID=2943436 RepID=UPI0024456A31|nr:glutathione S-transferase 1-like [Paramacrobiotus metropolitanus]
MPHYKVTYFDVRGRGEFVRMILGAAGQKFEDNRIAFGDWPQVKPNTPWGTCPVLEVDGKQLAQTTSVIRFVGHRYGLVPSGDWEEGLVDSVVEVSMDIFNGMEKIAYHMSDEEKPAGTKQYMEVQLVNILKNLEKFIAQHGSHGHCVGSKLTTADVCLFCAFDLLKEYKFITNPSFFDPYPKVKGVLDKALHNEKVAAYLKIRK